MGEPEHLISFEPLPGQVTAPVEVFQWRTAEHVGEPTDTEEAGRVEWVPFSHILDLARGRQILGAGALVPLLYFLTSRAAAGAGGEDGAVEPA